MLYGAALSSTNASIYYYYWANTMFQSNGGKTNNKRLLYARDFPRKGLEALRPI
jgi:hypothetical protein